MRGFSLTGYLWGTVGALLCFVFHGLCGISAFHAPTPIHIAMLLALEKNCFSLALSLFWTGSILYNALWSRPYLWWFGEIAFLIGLLHLYRHFLRPTFMTRTLLFWTACLCWIVMQGAPYSFLLHCVFLYTGVALWFAYDAWKTRTQLVSA